jgi:regulator of ribonuclease activity A
MSFRTSDLCDRFADRHLQIAEPIFKPYGQSAGFSGPVKTLKVFEDDVLLQKALAEPGAGRVLVIDGGGSHRCALVGADAARDAVANGWAGLIVYGCVRDSAVLNTLPIGIRAMHTHPAPSHHRRGAGEQDTLISFSGVNFKTGYFLYADEDGIIVADSELV